MTSQVHRNVRRSTKPTNYTSCSSSSSSSSSSWRLATLYGVHRSLPFMYMPSPGGSSVAAVVANATAGPPWGLAFYFLYRCKFWTVNIVANDWDVCGSKFLEPQNESMNRFRSQNGTPILVNFPHFGYLRYPGRCFSPFYSNRFYLKTQWDHNWYKETSTVISSASTSACSKGQRDGGFWLILSITVCVKQPIVALGVVSVCLCLKQTRIIGGIKVDKEANNVYKTARQYTLYKCRIFVQFLKQMDGTQHLRKRWWEVVSLSILWTW